VLLGLLAVLIVGDPGRIDKQKTWLRILTGVPRFVDYLSLAFWTATAISPTDISAIKPWAKLLMMLEAGCSIVLAALVIARAINVL
jgi:hypothetical protein